jgi:predicted RNA-binding Zn-ribbon protein involved in translation (DUF1610 family)
MTTVVGRFATIGEAESARSALEAAGIGAALADDEIVTLNWLYSNAVDGIKLVVANADTEDAIAILAHEATAPEAGTEVEGADTQKPGNFADGVTQAVSLDEAPTTIECPSCGSSDIARMRRLRLLLFLSAIVLGVGFAVGRPDIAFALVAALALTIAVAPNFRCKACGERWSATERREVTQAHLPAATDTLDTRCPRCDSSEIHHVLYRRLKAIPLFFEPAIIVVAPLWLLLPKWKCDRCGLKLWLPVPKATTTKTAA